MRLCSMPSLAEVAVGQTAAVVDVPGVDAVSLRLLEMGLTPGVQVAVVATAPLGDPLGTRLGLGDIDACRRCGNAQGHSRGGGEHAGHQDGSWLHGNNLLYALRWKPQYPRPASG